MICIILSYATATCALRRINSPARRIVVYCSNGIEGLPEMSVLLRHYFGVGRQICVFWSRGGKIAGYSAGNRIPCLLAASEHVSGEISNCGVQSSRTAQSRGWQRDADRAKAD